MLGWVIENKILDKEQQQAYQTAGQGDPTREINAEEGFKGALAKRLSREALLDEFAKVHADRGLQFERGEISTIPVENARDYLQEALDARIERVHGQEKPEQDIER